MSDTSPLSQIGRIEISKMSSPSGQSIAILQPGSPGPAQVMIDRSRSGSSVQALCSDGDTANCAIEESRAFIFSTEANIHDMSESEDGG